MKEPKREGKRSARALDAAAQMQRMLDQAEWAEQMAKQVQSGAAVKTEPDGRRSA